MRFEEVATLLEPDELPYTSGVERLDDGLLHVAVLTRMPRVTPDMIAWWFGDYMETTEHYKRWHPRDHLWMAWEDKRPHTHLGAKHLVRELIGGKPNALRIAFGPPEDCFGDALARTPGAVAICGRVGLLRQPIDIGRVVHLALPRPWGCDLHSRFWLGDVGSRSGLRLVDAVGNLPAFRRVRMRMGLGRALFVHCHEEMSTLAGFLPDLHASESAAAPPGGAPP
jgi:hypothetical protein